jgi:polyribonucleotide 5'-hydroxyl-kinase
MKIDSLAPAAAGVERHILEVEEELRLEVSYSKSCQFQITLIHGSAGLWGVELAPNTTYTLAPDTGGLKIAIFTWHGCVIDVLSTDGSLEMSYTSNETSSNVAAVNTNAQLEALRDEAAIMKPIAGEGPRVLIVGPPESGKSSLAKVLIAYAVKLGRTPIFVDLDPADNSMTVPGTLSACIMDQDTISVDTYGTTGLPVTQQQQQAQPLVLWHGGIQISPDLFEAQVNAMGQKIDQRLKRDDMARSSGMIVNTNGWIQNEGFDLLLHTVTALRINIVLVMGHDRLYSMMKNSIAKTEASSSIKIIKVPRSGGVVSRASSYMLNCRTRSIRRYFYGATVDPPNVPNATTTTSTTNNANASLHRISQLTPFAIQLTFNKLKLYKLSSISLSASLLPVSATQATEPVQLQVVEISEQLQHCVLAVCHPLAVAAYETSGTAKDLYESGVAGFCVVERILMDTEMIHLLSPCAGSLASNVLIIGDITWME